MRIVVLGGTKFIGAAAVRALVGAGHEVTCCHRGQTLGDVPDGVRRLLGPREALPGRARELAALRPDALLDMRCMTAGDAGFTRDLARAIGCARVVVASSADVYRAFGVVLGRERLPPDPVPLSEDAPLRARLYPYRRDTPRAADDPDRGQDEYEKQDVEGTLRAASDLGVTVVRLPMVHGPADPRRRVREWLDRMRVGRAGLVLGALHAAWRPCRVYVDDAGRGLALALTVPAAAGRIYHLADRPLSELDWARAIAQAAGWTGELVVRPDEALPEPLRSPPTLTQQLDLDAGRIERELGWRPTVSLADGLRRTVAWERTAPPPEPDLHGPPAERAARDAAEDALLTGG